MLGGHRYRLFACAGLHRLCLAALAVLTLTHVRLLFGGLLQVLLMGGRARRLFRRISANRFSARSGAWLQHWQTRPGRALPTLQQMVDQQADPRCQQALRRVDRPDR